MQRGLTQTAGRAVREERGVTMCSEWQSHLGLEESLSSLNGNRDKAVEIQAAFLKQRTTSDLRRRKPYSVPTSIRLLMKQRCMRSGHGIRLQPTELRNWANRVQPPVGGSARLIRATTIVSVVSTLAAAARTLTTRRSLLDWPLSAVSKLIKSIFVITFIFK